MGREDEGTYGLVSRLREALTAEGVSDEVGREVESKVNAICDRAYRRHDQLDGADALGYGVRLILDNEEGTFNEVRAMVRQHLAASDPCPFCEGSGLASAVIVSGAEDNMACGHCIKGRRARSPHQLGEALKDYVEVLAGLEGVERAGPDGIVRGAWGGICSIDTMAAEVLSTALAWVDWDVIAVIYLSECAVTEDADCCS